jgi:hypothetical protein
MRFNSWLQFFSNDIGSVGHEHPYRLTRSVRCARTAADHVMAEPANDFDEITRGRISAPMLRARPILGCLHQGFATGEMGFNVLLRSNNSQKLMPA